MSLDGGYTDVTGIFEEAGRTMGFGSLILMSGYDLYDAMTAFEIGEPRFDTGLQLDKDPSSAFNPLTPLLPEEVCWIMDRSFAYEIEWHAGCALSQTVFTLLFVHELENFDPDLLTPDSSCRRDPRRPRELITVVLRAFVSGLLKCCDLAWRDMSKGSVNDCEDWLSEKCDVSLLEQVMEQTIIKQLDEAKTWLQTSPKAPLQWRDGLQARILLRKAMLELMNCGVYQNRTKFQALVMAARHHLHFIRSHPLPAPDSSSPSLLAFNPYISRRLRSFTPLRVVTLPDMNTTWNALNALLDGLYDLSVLSVTTSIVTWQTVSYLKFWLTNPFRQAPWIRACTFTAFFNGFIVLNKFSQVWLVDSFLSEILGISWPNFSKIVLHRWISKEPPPLAEISQRFHRLIIANIRMLWSNHPRCRRELTKSLLEWHALYDLAIKMVSQLPPLNPPKVDAITLLPHAIALWRFAILLEIVLSGFQLELYNMDERTFAYWYITQITEEHVAALSSLLPIVPKGSPASREMEYQQKYLTALQLMSKAVFSVAVKTLSLEWHRMRLNFIRRYKWAFRPAYDQFPSYPPATPEYPKFLPACTEAFKNLSYSPSESCKLANAILLSLIESPGTSAGHWTEQRVLLLRNLSRACEGLFALPSTIKELPRFSPSTLEWDPRFNPWFPRITKPSVKTEEDMKNS